MFNLNKLCKAIATSVLAVSMLSSIATADVFDDKSKAEIEKIVDEYVSNHPEVIIKAMKKLEAQEMAKQQAAISDTVSLLRSNKDLPSVGKSDAKHFIIDFYDFNCGYCKVMEPLFEKALKDYDLQIVYVNIPVIKDESKQLAVVGQAIFNLDQKAYFKFHKHYMQPGHLPMDTDAIKASVEDNLAFNEAFSISSLAIFCFKAEVSSLPNNALIAALILRPISLILLIIH